MEASSGPELMNMLNTTNVNGTIGTKSSHLHETPSYSSSKFSQNHWQSLLTNWKNQIHSNLSISPVDTSMIFTNDEWGLLNMAKFAVNELELMSNQTTMSSIYQSQVTENVSMDIGYVNSGTESLTETINMTNSLLNSADIIVAESPSSYNIYQIVILAIIMTAMMIVIVVGNMLVVIAIATESNLATVQNWFIASLAVADMLIGLVIMPFSLSYELMGYWMFGGIWCDVHGAMDVLLCTASIMNICLISLDRYWSITKAVEYLHRRTPNLVTIMIATTWFLSCFISVPPLLGWKDDVDMSWFWNILSMQGNRSQLEFLEYVETSGTMDLVNFTQTLETVVYPQCMVS